MDSSIYNYLVILLGVALGLVVPAMKLLKIFYGDRKDLTKVKAEENLYSMLSTELCDCKEDNDSLRHRVSEKNRRISALELKLHELQDYEKKYPNIISNLDECLKQRKIMQKRLTQYEHEETVIGYTQSLIDGDSK